MMELNERVLFAFFIENILLPVNTTWEDVHYVDGDVGSTQTDIYFSLLLSLLMLTLRYCAQRFCFVPLAKVLGIKNEGLKTVEHIPLLEKAFLTHKKYSREQINGWSKQLDLSEIQIKRWMRLRLKQDKPGKLDKYCESCWKCLYYSFIFTFGLSVLWNTPWFWNIKECWTNYPNHPRTLGIWWYYMLSLAYYWSASISHFFDAERKDFWQMFIHHILTIGLLTFSWMARLQRIGTLILLTHDVGDIPMETAKIAHYVGWKKACNMNFVIFVVVWITTRTVIFPFWILRNALTSWPGPRLTSPGYYIFSSFLVSLLMLHIYWTYLLALSVRRIIASGDLKNDIRSDSSDSSD